MALTEYFFLACHHGFLKKFLQGGKKGFPGSKQNGLFKGRPTVGKFPLTNSELI